jgi:hypothetical protein
MILLRQAFLKNKFYSDEDEERKEAIDNAVIGAGAAFTGGSLASRKVRGRLTGKVVRYHNTEAENVKSILEEGLKVSKSNDPDSYTRRILRHLDGDKNLDNKIYTAKRRLDANEIGATKEVHKGNKGALMEIIRPTKHKTLKLVFDYDKDIKGSPKIENPELLGAKNWREYHERRPKGLLEFGQMAEDQSKAAFKSLGEGTHIFDHDIDPSKIVGGKGYKRRTLKDIKNYIKNNPKRFAKGVIPVAIGTGVLATGVALKHKHNKDKKKKAEKK